MKTQKLVLFTLITLHRIYRIYFNISHPMMRKTTFIFYWRIIALQNFAVSCQTSKWITIGLHISPSLLNLPPISFPIPPLQDDTDPLFQFSEPNSKLPLTIHFTYGRVRFLVTLSIHLTLSFPLPMSISLFLMSVSPLLSCK